MMRFSWSGERLFRWPAAIESALYYAARNSRAFGPCGKALCYATECNEPIVPFVASLRYSGSPYAILRAVASVIVLALQGVLSGRSRPNIGVEVDEGMAPSLTDDDAPPTIVSVSRVGCRVAPCDHRGPYPSFWTHAAPASVPVLCAALYKKLQLETSAASCRTPTLGQMRTHDCGLRTTGANARPLTLLVLVGPGVSNNGPATELQSSKILKAWIRWQYDFRSHDVNLSLRFANG